MTLLNINKTERKKYIKNIEKHLKHYHNYKTAIKNLEKQKSLASSNNITMHSPLSFKNIPPEKMIYAELNLLKISTETIEQAMKELTDIEKKYVECRYFKKWSVNKSALEIGYSDKAIFAIRNQVMEKLLISFGSLIYID